MTKALALPGLDFQAPAWIRRAIVTSCTVLGIAGIIAAGVENNEESHSMRSGILAIRAGRSFGRTGAGAGETTRSPLTT